MTHVAPAAHGRRRTLLVTLAVLVALALILWLTTTSAAPAVPARSAPTAQDVQAGRTAYWQLRGARGNKWGKRVSLGAAELAGLGAVASHGFRPDRLQLNVYGSNLRITGSHQLPMGRWLNVTLLTHGRSAGFPKSRLKVGLWNLPPTVTRWVFELGRWYVKRRTDVLPLDQLVRYFSVEDGRVTALISFPGKMGIVEEMAGTLSEEIDAKQVVRVYCALVQRQRKQPSTHFAEQVRRAFALDTGGLAQANFNRAAFVALGMLLVDQRVGEFGGISPNDVGHCGTAQVRTNIYGRFDWPKHWILSAAIAVGAGVQLSEAVGEWKELADSLERQSQVGDPTGFSLADLAADRAGFQAATAATQPAAAERLARALAKATSDQLLPHRLVEPEEALPDAEFVRRYGAVDDPRFADRVRTIDAVLATSGLR